jgi:exosortase
MKQREFPQIIVGLIHRANRSTHSRIVTCGLLVATCYGIVRLIDLLLDSLAGSSGILLLAASALGGWMLWQNRQTLKESVVSEEDRVTGYILIAMGAIFYPFCLFAIWSQAIVALIALAGVACSCWGTACFRRFPLATFLIAFGLLPRTTLVAQRLWQTFTPPGFLENIMAWTGSLGLTLIGQPAIAEGSMIVLSSEAVEVAYGCNGLYMAATMAFAGFILGLFLKQSGFNICLMMLIGALLALLFNIPRIMLMALAAAYWGEYWFDFWHGSWGGHIFVTFIFTIYYYVVMAIANKRSLKTKISLKGRN